MQETATEGWPEGRGSGHERVKEPGEHGGDLASTHGIRGANGAEKNKTLQASLPDFCFCLPIPAYWDRLP